MKKNAAFRHSALLLVDFINFFDFDGGPALGRRARRAAAATAKLKEKLHAQGVPCIYINDNYGDWSRPFTQLVDDCLAHGGNASAVTELLKPTGKDVFILKPRHSAFYGTPLEFLLDELKVQQLIVTGTAADNCVFATAQDGYVRKYSVWVPSDCIAAESAAQEKVALEHMRRILKARTTPSGRHR